MPCESAAPLALSMVILRICAVVLCAFLGHGCGGHRLLGRQECGSGGKTWNPGGAGDLVIS